jgi:hypothetical protein
METKIEMTKHSSSTFQKRVYRKLNSSPLSHSIPSPSSISSENPTKKIIPSSASKGLREDFKKTFLPLLIEIFELRQMIDTYRSQIETGAPISLGKVSKSPQEILEHLETFQKEIEESTRWCNGVILQIAKGIEEVKEMMGLLNQEAKEKKEAGFLKRLLKLIKK